MTYRERRERKAARLREWADKRDQKVEQISQVDMHLRHDWAFITQPGHIPARERINRRDEKTFEISRKADEMRERADSIEQAAERAIYSDDPDAAQQLQTRIADLEAKQTRMKTINAAVRRGVKLDDLALSEREIRDLEIAARFNGVKGYPSYALTNNGANIRRNRERLEAIQAKKD